MTEETKANVIPEEKKEKETSQSVSEKTSSSTQATEDKEEKKADIPTKFKKLIEEIEKMTVLELHELVKVLEDRFGVSAQAVAVASPGGAVGDGDSEEQSLFTVELKSVGEKKIAVIKAVKEILGLGLKDAKDLTDGAPSVLKEGVKKTDAEEMKKKIEDAGGTVTLK